MVHRRAGRRGEGASNAPADSAEITPGGLGSRLGHDAPSLTASWPVPARRAPRPAGRGAEMGFDGLTEPQDVRPT